MPRRCIAAGCNTVSGEGYSLHVFPRDQGLCAKWIRAVKRQRSNWEGPLAHLLLCSKHFEPDSFATEGVRYRDAIGLPMKKRLKPDTISTIFLAPSTVGRDLPLLPQDWEQRRDSDKHLVVVMYNGN